MTTHDASQALDPSDYVAQHLQHFSTASSASASAVSGQHVGVVVWNPYALLLAAAVFAVLMAVAARRDRGAVFSLGRDTGFARRLYVWWSCAWRQGLASTLLFIVAAVAFHFLMPRTAVPLMKFSHELVTSERARNSPMLSLMIAAMPVLVAIGIYFVVSLPLAGYMVRNGFDAHAFPGPERFGFRHAVLLGLTTYVWSVPASLVLADFAVTLPDHAADVLRAIFVVAWGMYIVLPRQVRRVGRLATA
ncbi:hypothetical protein [Paraburkholderia antibiotica]|uniref:Uncharacterized protein n=1 Tax=Paraburkholderia antibiotica TaxID=2728839 RepID=A0A7X9X4M5_9BURK|nr:hypothetical protein [Paraburkholderia antibiotica]NML31367.1 hypothetical protein [Paraburkholderia antibiotica]